MADDYFLSYAHKDGSEFADELHDELESDGYSMWLDKRDINTGEIWDESIQAGIQSCQVLIFIMTPGSVASKVCRAEWGYAIDEGKQIFPLYFVDCDIPLLLRPYNYIDFREGFDKGIAQLRRQLRKVKKK